MAQPDTSEEITLTIASSADTSGAAPLGGKRLLGLVLPAAFDANTARLIFYGSRDGVTYSIVKSDDNATKSITVAATNANKIPSVTPSDFAHVRFLKVQACQSDAATAVTQTAARTIQLIVDRITG